MRGFAHVLIASALVAVASTASADDGASADRIFGVLPNYTTVDTVSAPRQTTRESFRIASLSTFDPVVFPFVGVATAMGQGSRESQYGVRYARAFADNAVGNFMTTAVVPSLTGEDSRYYRRGEGAYSAASRTRQAGASSRARARAARRCPAGAHR